MQNVATKYYELSYSDDHVIFIDKNTNEIIIRIFNDNIPKLTIEAQNTDINIHSKNFSVTADKYITLDSKLPRNQPSVFINPTTR